MKENKLLKPAILYKDEIERKYCEYFYSREMYQLMGCGTSAIPQIKASGNDPGFRQFAIVDLEGNCIGYLHYTIYFDRRLVDAFELLGFVSTPLIGKALYDELYRLSHIYHLVIFGAVGSNPVIKHYMHACKKLKGSYVVERDVIMDNECNLDDYYRFQILNPDEKYVSKVNVISEDFSVKDSNDELTEDKIEHIAESSTEELIFATFTKREEDDKEDLSYLFRDTSYYGTWEADDEDNMVTRIKNRIRHILLKNLKIRRKNK